nr:MAG TPA: hypothetical protein [Caudoviricetes sp.]
MIEIATIFSGIFINSHLFVDDDSCWLISFIC